MSLPKKSDEQVRWAMKVQPRDWQIKALELWGANLRGIVQVVTGGGKTIFAQMCMLRFRERFPSGRVVVVVPTTALVDQWVVSLIEDMGVRADDIACYSGNEKPKDPKTINVVVINTARRKAAILSSDAPTFLIVDECHRAGSAMNALALEGKHAATLGLSATPEREYDEGFNDHIAPSLGPIIYKYTYVEAARDGVISPFALHNVEVTMLSDEEKRISSLTQRVHIERNRINKGTGTEDRLKRLLQQRGALIATVTMRIPAAIKLAERHLGQRTIIFHERVDAANHIKAILDQRHRSSTIYHAAIPPAVRRNNLLLFRRGVFDILICCRALDEGINVPETAVAIVASSTASTRQRIQRLGRVLRPAKGKDFADVYSIFATDVERERLQKEATELGGVAKVTWSRIK